MSNDPTRAELEEITRRTIGNYESTAESFFAGTRDHDVSQNIGALLRHVEGAAPFAILDLGCGPGRDLQKLKAMGHAPVGLDGTPRFVEMARAYSGCEVLHQNFLELDLPAARFDGVFANASLFHVPRSQIDRVIGELRRALRPRGVLFSSNPRGDNREGWKGERYGSFHDLAEWREIVGGAGFEELEHYYRPEGLPRHEQPWLASVWRKTP